MNKLELLVKTLGVNAREWTISEGKDNITMRTVYRFIPAQLLIDLGAAGLMPDVIFMEDCTVLNIKK